MGLVLLFYHLVLAREKMYQINRWYLLIGLAFSLVVPFLPIGMTDFSLDLISDSKPSTVINGLSIMNIDPALQIADDTVASSSKEYSLVMDGGISILLYLYGIVTLFLITRMGRQLYSMRKKAMGNPASIFRGYKIVLLNEEVIPHTFGKTIFVNKQQFDQGEISKEMLLHELAHARQSHTLDVLFIEILKAFFWFNPVLYYYKRAIQMNHEFIADHNVLSKLTVITQYQNALLSLSRRKLAGPLSTSLNFNVTKKRIMMMTSSTSIYRYILKSALILPFFVILGITFGCESASIEKDIQSEKIHIEILGDETIKLEGKTISVSQFASSFTDLSIDPGKVIFDMTVHDSATVGTVTDVQNILREKGSLKINYSKVSSSKHNPELK